MSATPHQPARGRLAFYLAVLFVAILAVPANGAEEDAPVLDEALLAEVLEVLGERYVDEGVLTPDNLTEGAIRGIVEALGDDGHTLYLTEEELEVEEDALDGRVVGIGVVIDQRAGSSQIISVVDGSPADMAGLQAGDVIASVDGTEVARLSIDDLAALVRGQVGTTVAIGVERPGDQTRLKVQIERANVDIDPVAWAFAPGSDVAVMRIVQFSAQSGREFRAALEDALSSGTTGIVLDLRGNPGGLVDEALTVAGSFLHEGVAYQEQGRSGQPREVPIAGGWAIDSETPMVTLVDYATASAAEILAVSLRDNDRAPIVGEQTFGTGTVLNTFTLADGSALRVGVLKWLTPDGEDVFRVGVTPDEPVELPLGAVALEPGDLFGMTAVEFANSEDVPLRHAVRLIEAG